MLEAKFDARVGPEVTLGLDADEWLLDHLTTPLWLATDRQIVRWLWSLPCAIRRAGWAAVRTLLDHLEAEGIVAENVARDLPEPPAPGVELGALREAARRWHRSVAHRPQSAGKTCHC